MHSECSQPAFLLCCWTWWPAAAQRCWDALGAAQRWLSLWPSVVRSAEALRRLRPSNALTNQRYPWAASLSLPSSAAQPVAIFNVVQAALKANVEFAATVVCANSTIIVEEPSP